MERYTCTLTYNFGGQTERQTPSDIQQWKASEQVDILEQKSVEDKRLEDNLWHAVVKEK
jgi:hypothetical protein